MVVSNPTSHVALLAHLQLHDKVSGKRVLPVFYSDNYLSLAPGEQRTVTVEAATADLPSGAELEVDGFNVAVQSSAGEVDIRLNDNAQPAHWPASNLVPRSDPAAQP